MKWTQVAPWISSAVLALLVGCGKAGSPPDAFPQAVADSWLGSFNSGDVDGLALMYTADARIMPPDVPTASGHDAIAAFWRGFNPGQVRISLGDVESSRLGEYWFREGDYTAMVPDEGVPRVGKFIELWKKDGANWLLYRQMWSRNSPPDVPEAPAAAPDESS